MHPHKIKTKGLHAKSGFDRQMNLQKAAIRLQKIHVFEQYT